MATNIGMLISVASKKILHWANVCFSAHAIAQPCRPVVLKLFGSWVTFVFQ